MKSCKILQLCSQLPTALYDLYDPLGSQRECKSACMLHVADQLLCLWLNALCDTGAMLVVFDWPRRQQFVGGILPDSVCCTLL